MVARPCVEPGCPAYARVGSRCPVHLAERKRVRNADRPIAAAVVAEWVAEHGWVCPGYDRPAHPSTDLTADHVVALVRGGTNDARAVLCRACNGAKGSR